MRNEATLKYIDKTGQLEKGIDRFPSVYIEGNAATGKTVVIRMFLEKHSEVPHCILDLSVELKQREAFLRKLKDFSKRMAEEELWLVLENMPETLQAEEFACVKEMLHTMKKENKLFFVSRSKPQPEFLQLLWKGKMGQIFGDSLLFSVEDIRTYFRQGNVSLDVRAVHAKTGGWPGCIAVLAHLAEADKTKKIEELLDSYEIKKFIEYEILDTLTAEERVLISRVAGCPWVEEALLKEVWNVENALEKLENLQRKGFFVYEHRRKRWKITPLFEHYIEVQPSATGEERIWYEKRNHITEAFFCLKQAGEDVLYQDYLLRYYPAILSQGIVSEELLKISGNEPKACYLRGIYYYRTQQFEKLQAEMDTIWNIPDRDFETKEILLNITYMNPQVSLTQWLDLLKESLEKDKKFRLYHLLGYSVTYLCGMRDLSGLFSCSLKEERVNAQLWKKAFGEIECKGYQLARIDYYLETDRRTSIPKEDWDLLREKDVMKEPWQIRLAKFYLGCKLQRMQYDERYNEQMLELKESLMEENDLVCVGLTECMSNLYASFYGEKEKMVKWLRYASLDTTLKVDDENCVMLYWQAKGYMLLNQYERAEKLLKKLIPYLQSYRRSRYLTELYYQYAIVCWAKNLKGQALICAIEAFGHCGNSRYVSFYAGYGKKGLEVLEAYSEWNRANSPERLSNKKKYNYGNVLRMPWEEYLDVVLRLTKKVIKIQKDLSEDFIEERLTMTEILVLQNIERGLSNQEICTELGVKMPTVKGHIYNLYKKLGVKSRGQALVKGKELGILKS